MKNINNLTIFTRFTSRCIGLRSYASFCIRNKHTALLSRLSKEDELIGDSSSILTQKAVLEEYAKQHGLTNVIHYIDDGYL